MNMIHIFVAYTQMKINHMRFPYWNISRGSLDDDGPMTA